MTRRYVYFTSSTLRPAQKPDYKLPVPSGSQMDIKKKQIWVEKPSNGSPAEKYHKGRNKVIKILNMKIPAKLRMRVMLL